MARMSAAQIAAADHSADARAMVPVREARADNRLWQRGHMLVQKLWRLHYHRDRVNTPLPAARGKR